MHKSPGHKGLFPFPSFLPFPSLCMCARVIKMDIYLKSHLFIIIYFSVT